MFKNLPDRRLLGVIFGCGLIGALFVLTVQFFSYLRLSDLEVEGYTKGLLERSVMVADNGAKAIAHLNGSSNALCSDADLADMRDMVFNSLYLADIGRIEGDQVLCTATWGRFDQPKRVGVPSLKDSGGGFRLWKASQGILPVKTPADMAARGSGISFTAPGAFKLYENPKEFFSSLVVSHNGAHVYRSFGDIETSELLQASTSVWYLPGAKRYYSQCDELYDICVVGRYNMPDLFVAHPVHVTLLLLAGLVVGTAIGAVAIYIYQDRLSWRQKLRKAINGGRLAVVYQPIVDLDTRKLIGAEALVRLVDEDGNWIGPDKFIPAAESYGFIGLITRTVVRCALRDMKEYFPDDNFYVSVNLAVSDFLDPEFLPFLEEEAALRRVSPHQVALELTERLTADHALLTQMMSLYRQSSFQILMDDFGTGYSSLSYMVRLPISGIKIDQMFVQGLDKGAIGSIVVGKVFELATLLNVKLICEGVENEAQVTALRGMRSDLAAQGYLFSKPLKINEFRKRFPPLGQVLRA